MVFCFSCLKFTITAIQSFFIFLPTFLCVFKVSDSSHVRFYSSVWCNTGTNISKKCIFTNLCYNHYSNFIFVLSKDSVLSGLSNRDDLKKIYATSVLGHSALPIKISIFNKTYFEADWITEPSFVLHRFKPDNLMHVIHDDLLPLFSTYSEICLNNVSQCAKKYSLFFADNSFESPFNDWYRAFSKNVPIQFNQLNKSQTLCFSKIHIGLSVDSVFYDYGFTKPKGAINYNYQIGNIINKFRYYLLKYFNIRLKKAPKSKVVFISRKLNRKIINEKFLEKAIIQSHAEICNSSIEIINTDFTTHSINEILSFIANAKYLIGMHGAGMFIGIFLPFNSVILELFPFGISAKKVSPLYGLSQIHGIHFRYFSWENSNLFNSFLHPEYPSHFGGLSHLLEKNQIDVLKMSSTNASPSYMCCNEPFFLLRMYQDTLVDESIFNVLNLAFGDHPGNYISQDLPYKEWFYPSFVNDLSCSRNISGLFLTWLPPHNMNSYTGVFYNVYLETQYKNVSSTTTSTNFKYNLSINGSVHAWITCIYNSLEGLESFIVC